MSVSELRVRRRRFFICRVADETSLDVARFLRGSIEHRRKTNCTLLCPVSARSIPLSAEELALVMKLPAHCWVPVSEVHGMSDELCLQLLELARRGVLLCDPPANGWEDLSSGEEILERGQWLDIAAVYQGHTQWQHAANAPTWPDAITKEITFEHLRQVRGDAPSPFAKRDDAAYQLPLNVPSLSGPFFEALLGRQTTRAYQTDRPLPIAALECLLYAVFGTHGIGHIEKGFAAIKRTSPSGGALHPIEAYVLAIHVEHVHPGLYHYDTSTHSLAQLERMDLSCARVLARDFTAGQSYFANAHALVIHVARFHRSFWKYAQHEKAYKAVLMESGHLSQTFYLTATHLNLGAFYTAAINDRDIADRLRLQPLSEAAIGINGVGIADNAHDDLRFDTTPYWPAITTFDPIGDQQHSATAGSSIP
jgi:putative peptide maturation dehydrogenase